MNIKGLRKRKSTVTALLSVTTALILLLLSLAFAPEAIAQDLPEVKQIIFYGNDEISDGDLKKVMNLKTPGFLSFLSRGSDFNLRILKLDKTAIRKFYLKKGFLSITVEDSFEIVDRRDIIIHIMINEGERVDISEINIRGNDLIADTEILRMVRSKLGDPLDPFLLTRDMIAIRTEYQKRGKPYVELTNQIIGGTSATIVIDIKENDTVYIDSVIVEGTNKVKEEIVRRELLFAKNEMYDLEKVLLTQRRIFETGLFSNVVIDQVPSTESDKTMNLLVQVREREMKQISGNFGFIQDRPSGVSEISTYLELSGEWAHRNLWHSGRAIRFKGSISFSAQDLKSRQSGIEAAYTEPWIFGFRAPTTIRTFAEREDVIIEPVGGGSEEKILLSSYGVELGIYKKYSEEFTARLTQGVRFIRIGQNPLALEEDPKYYGLAEDAQQRAITFHVFNDKRRDIFAPVNGSFASIDAKLAGGVFGGDSDLLKAEITWSRYQPFAFRRSVTMAFRIKGGYERAFGDSQNLPYYDRFFLGGNSSIRGYKERGLKEYEWETNNVYESLLSITKMLVNLEMRFPVYWRFGGEVFLDGGNLWSDSEEISITDLRFSLGAGLTFETPMGPARVDYGYKLNQSDYDKDARSRLHFGLMYAF